MNKEIGRRRTGRPALPMALVVLTLGVAIPSAFTPAQGNPALNNPPEVRVRLDTEYLPGVDFRPGVRVSNHLERFALELTADSSAQEFIWTVDGLPLDLARSTQRRKVIVPADSENGEYRIEVWAKERPSVCDVYHVKIEDPWSWYYVAQQEQMIEPGFSKEQLRENSSVDIAASDIIKNVEKLRERIRELFNREDHRAELRERWIDLKITIPFEEWIDNLITEWSQRAEHMIDVEIERFASQLENHVDNFFDDVSAKLNERFTLPVNLYAQYGYQIDSFDPGRPGWQELEVVLTNSKPFKQAHSIGFELVLSLKPAGVGVEKLPISLDIHFSIESQMSLQRSYPFLPQCSPTAEAIYRMIIDTEIIAGGHVQAIVYCKTDCHHSWSTILPKIGGYRVRMRAEKECPSMLMWDMK